MTAPTAGPEPRRRATPDDLPAELAATRDAPGRAGTHPRDRRMHPALTDSPAGPAGREPGQPWTLAEAAVFCRVSLSTLERRIRDGSLKSFKVGSRRLVADAEVKRLSTGG